MAEAGRSAAGRPAIVFLHGWTMDGSIFADQVRRLEPGWQGFAPTLPGHGDDAFAGTPDVDGAAKAVAAYIAANRIEKPVLVGWSLGAIVAWRLARDFPEIEVSGLVVIDMSPKIVNDDGWTHGIRGFEPRHNANALQLMATDWPSYAKRINAGMYARGDETPHKATLAMIAGRNPAAMASMWASLARADARDAVASLAVPTLIIKGARSRIYMPETAEWIRANAPDAKLVVFERSGHSPHLEEPEHFATVLSHWLETRFGN
jgi:pimeloyl-[acyl-carrier protein] methyl ester esterase